MLQVSSIKNIVELHSEINYFNFSIQAEVIYLQDCKAMVASWVTVPDLNLLFNCTQGRRIIRAREFSGVWVEGGNETVGWE